MLELTSTDAAAAAVARGRNIAAEAYTVHGPVLRALETAARNGACVSVRLEGEPFADRHGGLARENARLVRELRSAGADATLTHLVHAKALSVDGVVYLDEKNWQPNDLVLRASDGESARAVATKKHVALAREAELLRDAAGDDAIVESESFGCCNSVYGALLALAHRGIQPRLLVARDELRGNRRERAALEHLASAGVRVRVCRDSEKLASAGDEAWLGSANATIAFGDADLIDWGVTTRDRSITTTVRARLERTWSSAADFKFRTA